jgi:hypothetical protein
LELDTKPLPVKTTKPSDPAVANDAALTETTTHEPGSIEPCDNTAIAAMTDYEASKMAMTGPDQPEVIREIFKRQNMKQTKAPTMAPKTKEDQVQWIQLMWRSNENKLSVGDRYNETTTVIKIKTHLYNEDSVTFIPIRLVPINKPLDQSQKYERASVETKPHTNRAFIQDAFHYLTIIHGSDNLPPDFSMSQLDENNTHPRIAVGKNYKPEVNDIKRMVEECCMIEDLAENKGYEGQPPVGTLREIMEVNDTEKEDPHNTDPGPGTVDDQEDLDHAAPGQEPENRHQEDESPYTYEHNDKPDLGDILDQDQQNAQRRVTTANSTHLHL